MRNFLVISMLLSCAACGGGTGGGDPGTAVKMQPLAGTIQGKSFSAVSATARAGGNGESVTIYPKMVGCTDNPTLADGDMQIGLTVPTWTAGSSYQLNLSLGDLANSKTVDFVVEQGMTPQNYITGTGRVEVQQTGMNAMLGLRATDPMYGSVEGTIAVSECM
jgi:hypothetical protein